MKALLALGQSCLDLFRPQFLLLLFLPPLVSFVFWGGLAYLFWEPIVGFTQSYSDQFLSSGQIPTWIVDWLKLDSATIATTAAALLAILLIVPLGLVSSLLITSLAVMPVIVPFMKKQYPDLQIRGEVNLGSNIKNIVQSTLLYLFLWAASIPLWIVPGLGFAIPMILNSYLNYRLFAFDCLGTLSPPAEIEKLLRQHRLDFLYLGLLLAVLLLFPLFYFVYPVLSALAFTRYSFVKLRIYRLQSLNEPIEMK